MAPKRTRADDNATVQPPVGKRRSARRSTVKSSAAVAENAEKGTKSGAERKRKNKVKADVKGGKEDEGKREVAEKAEVVEPGKEAEEVKSGVKRASSKPTALATAAEKKTEKKSTTKLAPPSKSDNAQSKTDDRPGGTRFWLMKAEPDSRIEKGKDVKFSVDDLAACKAPAAWDGVRNYAARNNMRAMKKGDLAFFYHSNCKQPGIVGIMEIVGEATVDETAFDPAEPYYDPKSSRDNPKWDIVYVEFRRKLKREIGLQELKGFKDKQLKEMPLLKMGRLSVSEVPKGCWDFVLGLEKREGP